jgi:putative tributyrin esterase
MAHVRIDHLPGTSKVSLPLNIIVPDPAKMDGVPVSGRRVLYMLLGVSDDKTTWKRFSAMDAIASAYGLVVVMPTVGRSFYIDMLAGHQYMAYLIEELPRYLVDVFALAPLREDTFIVGNSLGGYAALKTAFLHPQRFAAAASFSGVLSLDIAGITPDILRQAEFALLSGVLDKITGSEHDPLTWLKQTGPADLPRLYNYTGRQEDIHPLSARFQSACKASGVACEYIEEDGRNDSFLWEKQVRHFLAAILGPIPKK